MSGAAGIVADGLDRLRQATEVLPADGPAADRDGFELPDPEAPFPIERSLHGRWVMPGRLIQWLAREPRWIHRSLGWPPIDERCFGEMGTTPRAPTREPERKR